MSLATAMYYGEKNPLKRVSYRTPRIYTAKILDQRRLQKIFLRCHDQKNWPFLRQALRDLNRSDLIGSGKHQLVPEFEYKGQQRARRHTFQKARGGQWDKRRAKADGRAKKGGKGEASYLIGKSRREERPDPAQSGTC